MDTQEYKNRVEIELLKKDIATLNRFYGEFHDSIEKMKEAADRMNRIVYLQEQKFLSQDKQNEELNKQLEKLREQMIGKIEQNKEENTRKLDELNKWKYMVVGAASVVSFLIATLLDMAKLFKG